MRWSGAQTAGSSTTRPGSVVWSCSSQCDSTSASSLVSLIVTWLSLMHTPAARLAIDRTNLLARSPESLHRHQPWKPRCPKRAGSAFAARTSGPGPAYRIRDDRYTGRGTGPGHAGRSTGPERPGRDDRHTGREHAGERPRTAAAAYAPLVGRTAAGVPTLAEQQVVDVPALPRQLVGEGELFVLTAVGESMIDSQVTVLGKVTAVLRAL